MGCDYRTIHFSLLLGCSAHVFSDVLRVSVVPGQDLFIVLESHVALVQLAEGVVGMVDVEYREGPELQVQPSFALRGAESCGRLDGPYMVEVCGKPLLPLLPCLDADLELARFDGRVLRVEDRLDVAFAFEAVRWVDGVVPLDDRLEVR